MCYYFLSSTAVSRYFLLLETQYRCQCDACSNANNESTKEILYLVRDSEKRKERVIGKL